MKPIVRLLLGIVIGAAAVLGGTIFYEYLTSGGVEKAPDLPHSQSAVLTHIAGLVYVVRGTDTLRANPGDRLEPGDIVKVTEGGVAQVQLADKGSALLGSDTLVRFMKLTGADQKLELRTEILTGSLSYKVEKLDDRESIVIEAEGNEYEVRGTEFLIEKSDTQILLAVRQGEVGVRGNLEGLKGHVGPNQQLIIQPGEEPGIIEELTPENRQLLEDAAPLPTMPFGFDDAPEPVRIEISTYPPDAHIYIDGLKTGVGGFQSLLPKGTVIAVRVRRRGFEDEVFDITADTHQYIEVELKPADVKATLEEERELHRLPARLRADYERRLAELRNRFALKEADDEAKKAALAQIQAESQALLEIEKARGDILETELADSHAENEQLRDLIRQIQELAEE